MISVSSFSLTSYKKQYFTLLPLVYFIIFLQNPIIGIGPGIIYVQQPIQNGGELLGIFQEAVSPEIRGRAMNFGHDLDQFLLFKRLVGIFVIYNAPVRHNVMDQEVQVIVELFIVADLKEGCCHLVREGQAERAFQSLAEGYSMPGFRISWGNNQLFYAVYGLDDFLQKHPGY